MSHLKAIRNPSFASSGVLCKIWRSDSNCQNRTGPVNPELSAEYTKWWGQETFGIGTQPDSLPVRSGATVAQSPPSPLRFGDSYLPVKHPEEDRTQIEGEVEAELHTFRDSSLD